METPQPGMVSLVGAGPGDPGLITVRGESILRFAEVVIYDHLANRRLLDLVPAGTELIRAGKSVGHCDLPQDEINALMVHHARLGKRVVRLKGGDPFVFGRGAEEAEFLRAAGIPFEVVPGITAGVGATAYAGIPVTHRDDASATAFVTGHSDPESPNSRLDWKALAAFPGTLVVYMGVTRLAAICRTLIAHGKPPETPAAVVQSGSWPTQRVVSGTLADLPDVAVREGIAPPALLVIGDVVLRREHLNWFESAPLRGRRIVITRPSDSIEASADWLEHYGAEALLAPTVQILPIENWTAVDDAIRRLRTFDWLVFTSSNGVKAFLDRLAEIGLDLRVLGNVQLAAIGPSTAESLAQYHLRTDVIPGAYRSEELAAELRERAAGQRVLLARADRGRTVLKDELTDVAEVEQIAVYRNADAETIPDHVRERIEEGSVDWITLTSSAITRRLHALISESGRARIARGEIKLASISPVTSEAARELGWPITAEASEFTWPGVVRAILAHERAEA